MKKIFVLLIVINLIIVAKNVCAKSEYVVANLKATTHSGQVFLTWDESPVPESVTFNVFMDFRPITSRTLSNALLVGQHIEAGSACDWWQNPASYSSKAKADRSHGFLIDGKELNPRGGLFVHTIIDNKPMYFAVLPVSAASSTIVTGINSLKVAVKASPEILQPIRLKDDAPKKNCGIGKSLNIKLHARGGGSNMNNKANFLVFGDGLQGWREGLARKFIVEENDSAIIISPLDRLWVGRPLLFSWDERDHVQAINTWWYGSNQYIYDASLVKDGLIFNYTEEHLLYLIRWAQQYFGTDPDKTYLRGKSMGGSGTISMALHHPEVFAAIYCDVPIVAYTNRSGKDGSANIRRLDGLCGRVCDETVMSSEGIPVMRRMNNELIVTDTSKELPFIVLCNGRTDGSIPWINNPSFYKSLNENKRGFVCYWNNGGHTMGFSVPEDIREFYSIQPGIQLGTSYPAFSNFSDNCNPGKGEFDDGDKIGSMNRGIYWTKIEETENSWSIQLFTKGDFLPEKVVVDVTLRQLIRFHIVPNEMLIVNKKPVKADNNGLITIPKVQLELGKSFLLKVNRSL